MNNLDRLGGIKYYLSREQSDESYEASCRVAIIDLLDYLIEKESKDANTRKYTYRYASEDVNVVSNSSVISGKCKSE